MDESIRLASRFGTVDGGFLRLASSLKFKWQHSDRDLRSPRFMLNLTTTTTTSSTTTNHDQAGAPRLRLAACNQLT